MDRDKDKERKPLTLNLPQRSHQSAPHAFTIQTHTAPPQCCTHQFTHTPCVCVCVLYRRKVEIMHTHSLFTLLGERLMLHTNTITVTIYNTLYEVQPCSL